MSVRGLNLARRPFVNRRPVRRLAILLWLVGGGLLVANAQLYWRYFSGEGERGEILQNLEGDISRENAATKRLERELATFDLEWQNGQVEFLNEKIGRRVFSWSALFDDLAEVLPADAQLTRVSPSRTETSSRRSTRRVRGRESDSELPGAVELSLIGGAKQGEALLALVDALFDHPRFRDPDLARETKLEDGSLGFTMRVVYLPAPTAGAAEPPSAGRTVEEAVGGDPAGGAPAEAARILIEAADGEVEG